MKFDRHLGSKAIWTFQHPISHLLEFAISHDQTSYRILKAGCNHGNTRTWFRWRHDCKHPCPECKYSVSFIYFQSPTDFQIRLFAFPQIYGSHSLTNASQSWTWTWTWKLFIRQEKNTNMTQYHREYMTVWFFCCRETLTKALSAPLA